MGLLEDLSKLEDAKKRTGGQKCRVSVLMRELPEKEAELLRHLIDETDVFATQIAEAFKSNGYQVNAGHIQHHRRRKASGGCTCPRPGEEE